ncbi:hypothetical protein AB1K09_20230 [Solibacillus silvestris]
MHWTEKEFAFYRGDVYVYSGTVTEIAAFTGYKDTYIRWMATPASKELRATRKIENSSELVPIMDETRPLMTYRLSDRAIDALSSADIYTTKDLLQISDSKLKQLHPNKVVVNQIARYRDWFLEVDKEWEDECDEAM